MGNEKIVNSEEIKTSFTKEELKEMFGEVPSIPEEVQTAPIDHTEEEKRKVSNCE